MRLSLGLLAAPVLFVAGCAGAPTRIHTLDAMSPIGGSPGGGRSPAAFRIDAVHIPPAFDRPALIRRTEPYTLTLSDTDRWAAPLGELVRRTLTQDLAARMAPGVVIYPDAPKPAAARGLVVDILSIAPTDRGVEMDVSWTWIASRTTAASETSARDANPAATIASPNVAHLSAPSAGSGPSAIAPEISALLGQLADRIAATQ